jgi:hypothetical protein
MSITSEGALTGSESQDLDSLAEVRQQTGMLMELGVTGLKRSAGYIDEEFLPQLRGRKSVQVYREMSENDPIVGSLLFAVTQLLRNVDWTVVPAGKNKEDSEAAKLVETCMDDMSTSWNDFVAECMSCITYGWSWHEIVYKRRMGPWQSEGKRRSKYADGLIGWRKMPIRSQETLLRWIFDESGDVRAMVQLAPPDYKTRILPIEKSLLFRWGQHKNNPEGRSMLRTAYRPYFYKKRLEEFEAIGVERDLAGLPKISVPMNYLKARPGTEQFKVVDSMRKMVRSIRRNEQEGLIFPRQIDQETKQDDFAFELLGSGGARQFSTDPLIQRYAQWIFMTVLADWIMVGHQQTGTYNMHVDKTGIFKTALNATAQSIADVINRHAIPRLFAVNGWKPERLPIIKPSDVDPPDLTQLAQFMGATAGLGFTWGPDAEMETWLRNIAGMPGLGEDDLRKRRKEARQEESTRFAEEELRYLTTRSQLAQVKAQQQMDAQGIPHPDEVAQQQQAGQQTQDGADNSRRAEEQHQMSMVQAIQGQGSGTAAGGQNGSSGRPPSGGQSR